MGDGASAGQMSRLGTAGLLQTQADGRIKHDSDRTASDEFLTVQHEMSLWYQR